MQNDEQSGWQRAAGRVHHASHEAALHHLQVGGWPVRMLQCLQTVTTCSFVLRQLCAMQAPAPAPGWCWVVLHVAAVH